MNTEIKKTYTATAPDGTVITRNSKADYRFAVMCQNTNGKWVASFHTAIKHAWKQEAKDLIWMEQNAWISVVLVGTKVAA